jgi:dephospho-CoA kinase
VTVIGLVGGVAAGKSEVARELERQGAGRIDADAIAHEILREPEVVAALVERFGDSILDEDGHVDRGALGTVVFEDGGALGALESVLHPRVRRRIEERLGAAESGSVVVLDAALLLENGLAVVCDVVVMVESREENRERRAIEDRGWPVGEVARRERHQAPVEEKRRRADLVIENDGSAEDLREAVRALWERLIAIGDRGGSPRRTG